MPLFLQEKVRRDSPKAFFSDHPDAIDDIIHEPAFAFDKLADHKGHQCAPAGTLPEEDLEAAFRLMPHRIATRRWLHAVLLLLVCAGTFSNTLDNSLQLDDAYRVGSNPEVDRVWPPWRHFVDPRTSTSLPQIEAYRPLLPLSLSVNNAVSDRLGIERLAGYHLGNLAIHLAAGWLVYLLFCELLIHWSRLKWPRERLLDVAFGASLLFAIHPVAGVPVNYISGRDLLMMMLFLIAALLAYLRLRRLGDSPARWAVALGLFALSLIAKQNGVFVPLLILLFELGPARSVPRSLATWARSISALLTPYSC